ncbi:hypothetical protein Patl1_05576 [Pistacia atlantica]|uniref:Uncharacterized protein n=1 Tax=Pistacia atlantica TaxID=434234 RepID=A0ACC1BQ57_9ROSI|nr:hypothetical protein Patl1_05576 [Pistacia atlantica]
MRLKELAKDLEDQRKKQNNASKGEKILSDQIAVTRRSLGKNDAALASSNKGNQDAMLAAPAAANLFQEDGDEDEEIMMPIMDGNVDQPLLQLCRHQCNVIYLFRSRSMMLRARRFFMMTTKIKQIWWGVMRKEVMLHQRVMIVKTLMRCKLHRQLSYKDNLIYLLSVLCFIVLTSEFRLAASMAVEEHESLTDNETIPAGSIPFKEEDGDEDEEVILVSLVCLLRIIMFFIRFDGIFWNF